jgi:glycosyltransferase involved in cell wall biosynthesis
MTLLSRPPSQVFAPDALDPDSIENRPDPRQAGSVAGAQQLPANRSERVPASVSVARPLVSLVLPAYNEEAIVEENLGILCRYMAGLEDEYRWEIVLINDGSLDRTGAIAVEFARSHPQVTVLHHPANFGMGQALISGFRYCRADYVITLDLDLSFAPDHIPALLKAIRETSAQIVLASPFADGGRISHVPWARRLMSVWANRLLAKASNAGFTSITGVGRVYDGRFLRTLNVRATGMDINAEILFKALMLRARVVEIPAHLDWQAQVAVGAARRSKLRIWAQVRGVLGSGFLFRPTHPFLLPGLALLLLSIYTNAWMLSHWWTEFQAIPPQWILTRASEAARAAFALHPHTFVLGGLSLMVAIQLLGMSLLSLQQKRYFEDLFHLGSSLGPRSTEAGDDSRVSRSRDA